MYTGCLSSAPASAGLRYHILLHCADKIFQSTCKNTGHGKCLFEAAACIGMGIDTWGGCDYIEED